MIDAPKNLTKNILIGLILGFVVGSLLFYTDFVPSAADDFVEKYIFQLGGDIFMNLLKLLVVPLVFFSLATNVHWFSMPVGPLSLVTVGLADQ